MTTAKTTFFMVFCKIPKTYRQPVFEYFLSILRLIFFNHGWLTYRLPNHDPGPWPSTELFNCYGHQNMPDLVTWTVRAIAQNCGSPARYNLLQILQ